MIDIKNYESLEKYIECGISKMIGKRFVNKDNIDKIVTKIIKYDSKFDPSKKMAYSSYIHMIVKTTCYSIFKSSNKIKLNNDKLKLYKQHKISNADKDNASLMIVVDKIMSDNILSDLEKSIIDRKYLKSQSVRKICEELNLKKGTVNSILNTAIFKLQNYYSSVDKIREEVEEYGQIID